MDAITLTFGDCMENHAGMQKVGTMSSHGYTYDDLRKINKHFKKLGPSPQLFFLLMCLITDLLSEAVNSHIEHPNSIWFIKMTCL